jgi:hypothetical protein
MAAIMEAVGTGMGWLQSVCGIVFMATVPELVWAASAMDIAHSVEAVSGGAAVMAIVLLEWAELGLVDAGSVVRM